MSSTGGASTPAYGADAVAGVVNFIIDSHFEGVRVDAGYHFNQHNNSDQNGVAPLVSAAGDALPPGEVNTGFGKNAAIIMGTNFANNTGNATTYVTYDNQAATVQGKFDYSACGLAAPPATPALACGGSVASRSGLFFASGASGTLIDDTVDQTTGLFRPFVNPGDTHNYAPVRFYQTPNERWTTGGFVNYDFNSHVAMYTTVMYMRNSMTAQLAPSGAFGQATFIACADPLLTAQEVATLCAPGERRRQRRKLRGLQRQELSRSQHANFAPRRRERQSGS